MEKGDVWGGGGWDEFLGDGEEGENAIQIFEMVPAPHHRLYLTHTALHKGIYHRPSPKSVIALKKLTHHRLRKAGVQNS